MNGDRCDADAETIYCRRLGHDLTFAYCRQGSHRLPCAAIYGCWQERLPVADILAKHYSPDQLRRAFRPRQDKLTTILGLVEQIRTG
jgi:hypothetical protein